MAELTEKYAGKKVAIIGFTPEKIDLSAFPGLTPEKIRADLENHKNQLIEMGIDARIYLLDAEAFTETSVTFAEDLRTVGFDVVEVGAGMRKTAQHIYDFEQAINLIHTNAPATKFCFNLQPDDTINAILRWL